MLKKIIKKKKSKIATACLVLRNLQASLSFYSPMLWAVCKLMFLPNVIIRPGNVLWVAPSFDLYIPNLKSVHHYWLLLVFWVRLVRSMYHHGFADYSCIFKLATKILCRSLNQTNSPHSSSGIYSTTRVFIGTRDNLCLLINPFQQRSNI